MKILNKGDSVQVKMDPVLMGPLPPEAKTGQGRLLEKADLSQPNSFVEFAWDSLSLQALPLSLIKDYAMGGLDWSQISMPVRLLEPAEPRDTLADVEYTRQEIQKRLIWAFLKPSQIQALATHQSYGRGQAYLKMDAVAHLRFENGVCHADVQGAELYSVQVAGSPESIKTFCNCPYDRRDACKHVVATLLAIRDEWTALQPIHKTTAEKSEDSLAAIVESLPAARLRQFILQEMPYTPHLAEHLRIFAQGEKETGKSVEDYTGEILEVLENVDFSLPDPEADVLGLFQEKARKYREQGNWREACKLYEAILRACLSLEQDEHFFLQDNAENALLDWSNSLCRAPSSEQRKPGMDRLGALFASNFFLSPEVWDEALSLVLSLSDNAKNFLQAWPPEKQAALEALPDKALPLIRAFRRAGCLEDAVRVGQKNLEHCKTLAMPLAEVLIELGRKAEAVRLLELFLTEAEAYTSHSSFLAMLDRLPEKDLGSLATQVREWKKQKSKS